MGYFQGEYFARRIGGNWQCIAPSRFGFLSSPVPDGAEGTGLPADAQGLLMTLYRVIGSTVDEEGRSRLALAWIAEFVLDGLREAVD